MSQNILEFIKMEMLQLFENPKKKYRKFSKSIQQDMETKSFKTFASRLNCFIDILSCNDISKDTATKKIEELVHQGMVETMLWDAFINLISQPVSPTVTNAMVALLQTLCNITDNMLSIAKTHICTYLPYLLRDVIGNEKNEYRLRIEGTKLINNLLEQNPLELHAEIEKIRNQKTIRDDAGTLILNATDFELQAQLLEMVFRLVPALERTKCVSSWFQNEELQNLFLKIEDAAFEPGCRKFLNKLNESNKGVFSIPCQMVLFGSQHIPLAMDVGSGNYWLDFNFGSKTLKFFFEEKEEAPSENEADDIWWRTVVIELNNVFDCNLFEQHDGILLKITLKENVTSLIPSWSSNNDIHNVQIKCGPDCDVNTLKEVLERFSWIRPDRSSSPKASVAVYSVHLADRKKGQMEILPIIGSKPPKDLMAEDGIEDEVLVNNSEITASLDDKEFEESKVIVPSSTENPKRKSENVDCAAKNLEYPEEAEIMASHLMENSPELQADHSSSDINNNIIQMNLMSSNVESAEERLEHKQLSTEDTRKDNRIQETDELHEAHKIVKDKPSEDDDAGKKSDMKKRGTGVQDKERSALTNKRKETNTPPEKKAPSNDTGSGTDSTSSRRSLRRSPRGHASSKKPTKSPLRVEIIKADRKKTSSSSGKSSTDSENDRKSLANKAVKKSKSYPSAFNVEKRMEAKRNSMTSTNSQEIKNKVFGQRGFSQVKTLHIMAPARRVDHSEGRQSPPLRGKPSSKKQQSQRKISITKERADGYTTAELDEEEREVIQDSLPLDDSPEVTDRGKSAVPKATKKKMTDERLTRSESSKMTKKRIEFETSIPTRVGTVLRKGGPKYRGSLLEERNRSGWGSTSSSSTSETDWPGPDVQEPGPKAKHSLVLCKSVREKRRPRNRQEGEKKSASVSHGLSAISEEKSPLDNQLDEPDAHQLSCRNIQDQTKSFDSPKESETTIETLGGKKKRLEIGYKSDDFLLDGETRKTMVDTNTSHNSKSSRDKKANTKKKIDGIDFEKEFDFDVPDLTVLAMKETPVGEAELGQGSTVLLASPTSLNDHDKSRSKSDGNARMLLDDDDENLVYTASQEYTTLEDYHKPDDIPRSRSVVSENGEQHINDVLRHQDNSETKQFNSSENKDSVCVKNKLIKEDKKEPRRKLPKRGFSEDEFDEDSDIPNRNVSPKRRKTYGTKQRQIYSKPSEKDWIKDKESNTERATSYPSSGWQLYSSSKQDKSRSTLPKVSPKASNRSDEEFQDYQSGYEMEDHDHDSYPNPLDHEYSHKDERKETRISGGRKGEQHNQAKSFSSLSISKSGKHQEHVEEEDEEESNDVLKLRKFCQEITAPKSSTPAPKLSSKELLDKEAKDGMPAKRLKGAKNERFETHQLNDSSRYTTPTAKQGRMNDSGLGRSVDTGSRKRSSLASGSSTSKGMRRKGELLVTTSISKTPVTPRTSAIMRSLALDSVYIRIDEEENFEHTKKSRQIFVDWTSSGPSRTVSSPFQEPFHAEITADDHPRKHLKAKGKGGHNPNIIPRQLFRPSAEGRSHEEEFEDGIPYDETAVYEDARDISEIISGLDRSLNERLRRKRQNLQRFCKRTMDATIDTISRHFEQNHSNREKVIDSFNDQFLDEIKILKEEMDKAKKTEEQILARIEEDMKILKTRRVLQENKIKGLRNLCVEFQSEMIKDGDSQTDHQELFQNEIREELFHIQEHFLSEAQKQDRENLRRSLQSVLDATML